MATAACDKAAAAWDELVVGHALRQPEDDTHHRRRDDGGARGGGVPGVSGKVGFTVEPFTDRPSGPVLAPQAGIAFGHCRCCMMRLPENRDIFIYKGEKVFRSNECREGYIKEEIEDA